MDQLVQHLRAIAGPDNVISEPDELLVYECDGLTQYRHRPRAVVFPTSTEATAAVVQELARAGVPFAPRGAGTGLSGGALALDQGVTIELARMRRVLEVDVDNRLAVVQTGLVNAQLSRAVAPHGLHYVPDPSSGVTCTIGGNIAENAGGIHCLKYGTTTDHVIGARVVLSDGAIIDLGGAGADASGYDLLGVFVGSEGTFGIATEATVRLVPLPQSVRTLLADFTDVNDASRAVSAIIAAGLVPAALEMVDGATIRAVEASVFAAGLPLDAEAALLIELDGLEAGLDAEAAQAEAICRTHGARQVRHALDEQERKKLWAARKGAFGAMGRLAPDMMLQDAVVPRSRLPEVLAETYRIGAKYRLRLANVFHAGDGNLHPILCFDRRDADEVRRVEAANREIVETCVRAGGTLTGEHGIGLDKSAYMPLIFSADDLATMLQVRAAFDPTGLCNPGKIIPAPRGCGEARAVARLQPADAVTALKPTPPLNLPTPPQTPSIRSVFNIETVRRQLAALVGAEQVTQTEQMLTVAPATVEEAGAVMSLAARDGLPVVPAGAATWLDAGNALTGTNIIITTRRLTRMLRHEPADLIATVEAGMTLAELNEATMRAGQWLPLDPPDDGRATVGGVVATGMGGAQSYGYGNPRAFVLGMRVVLADGRQIKAGGIVVKNVAGYDLCKLFTGSYGTLGLLTELTFKLRPRPAREATLIMRAATVDSLFAGVRQLRAGMFLPVAVELLSPPLATMFGVTDAPAQYALLIRFAGTDAAVADQTERARSLFARAGADSIELLDMDEHLWHDLAAQPMKPAWPSNYRICVRPAHLPALIAALQAEADGQTQAACWHAGLGDGRMRILQALPTDATHEMAVLARLRHKAMTLGGALIIERAPDELKRQAEAWGLRADTAQLMQRIKRQLDPAELLSPGRFALCAGNDK